MHECDCDHPITVLPSQHYNHGITITPLPSRHRHHGIAITALRSRHCHHSFAITALPSRHCHHSIAITALPSWHCHHSIAITALPSQHCNPSITITALPSQYCHHGIALTALPSQYWAVQCLVFKCAPVATYSGSANNSSRSIKGMLSASKNITYIPATITPQRFEASAHMLKPRKHKRSWLEHKFL